MIEPGQQIGRYEVVGLLGSGGMGEVYRAFDTRLQREVALKLLPPEFSDDAIALGRLEQEARAASALNHPNIVTIYDLDRIGEISVLVCELIEGESLRSCLARGALTSQQAAAVTRAVAQALGAAHAAALVHRDLKPENVMLTVDGRIKLLDFGIAKQIAAANFKDNLTRPGDIMGTPRYLSPEQLRGLPAEPRSDLFALGVLLYEMLCGHHPFQRNTDIETAAAVLGEPPADRPEVLDSVGVALLAVACRCMDKRPQERPDGATAVVALVDAITQTAPLNSELASARISRPTLVVLPLNDRSGGHDNRHLSLGLADAIVTELASNRRLVVRPLSMLLRELEAGADPYDLARRHGANAVVEGSFQRSDSRIRVTLQLLDLAERRPIWGTKVDAEIGDLFGLEDSVACCVAEAMRVELTPAKEPVATLRAPAARAYELCLKGRMHLNHGKREDNTAAIACFEAATDIDPGFVQAWVGLSEAYARKAFAFEPDRALYDKAQALCDKALSLDPNLPEIHNLLGSLCWCPANGFDHRRSLECACLCLARRPGLADAHHLAGRVLSHVGLIDDALRAFQAALRCNPGNEMSSTMVGYCRYLQGHWREALDLAQEVQGKWPWAAYHVGLCQLQLGDLDAVARTIEAGRRAFPQDGLFDPLSGLVAAREGRSEDAHAFIEATIHNERAFGHYHHAQYDIACIYAALGDSAQALTWLAAAAHNGFPCGSFFARDPMLATLRGDGAWLPLVQPCDLAIVEQAMIYDRLGCLSGRSS